MERLSKTPVADAAYEWLKRNPEGLIERRSFAEMVFSKAVEVVECGGGISLLACVVASAVLHLPPETAVALSSYGLIIGTIYGLKINEVGRSIFSADSFQSPFSS